MTGVLRIGRVLGVLCFGGLAATAANAADDVVSSFEVYGFVQADYIQDFNRVNPDWDATLRPSRIPTDSGLYGSDGQAIISVRQSRLGVQATLPVDGDTLYTKFEFDLYGVGGDAGQTTFRLRHAYGQWGDWLAGQTNSLFMDIDVFPNVIDYWGPDGMVFLRNPQIRWMPISGANNFAVAIEQPSNDIDSGQFREVDSFPQNVHGDEKYPDLTTQFRANRDWGHVQIAGIFRYVGFDTPDTPSNKPKGSELGWGIDLSTNIKTLDKDKIILSVVYGEGIASYMNDGGVDLAPKGSTLANASAAAVPLLGVVAYYDHYWNEQWSSSIGYSTTRVDNEDLQDRTSFKSGQYASANLLHYPAKNIMVGAEVLWGQLENKAGEKGDDSRVQISVKYNFSSNDFKAR